MEPAESARGRLLIALGAAIVLAATIVAVLALGGGDEERSSSTAASATCIRTWNTDPAATSYGRHNFNFHSYTGALVTYLTEQAEEVGEGEGGICAVIFPSEVLDTEPFAAGQVLRKGKWLPITSLESIELTRVGELQAQAAQEANTILDTAGRLTAN
jgi:hypothetical protein